MARIEEAVYPNEPLRLVMDKYQIRIIERHEREFRKDAIPEDFKYRGNMLEVRMGEQAVFCRFEGIGAFQFYGKKYLLPRFPDWEGWLLYDLLSEAGEPRWYEEHSREGMEGWLHTYGDFGSPSKNAREWKYACRAMNDLESLFGETVLKEIQDAIKACTWDTDGLS